ncbi:MAG: site-2 protease family protein [Phycisphaerales bacterium]|nr:MAG: site-2 protease family protein [Phycisphaerales bacterium]
MIWTDGQGRDWHVDADPQRITVRSGDDVLRLERADWNRDLYVGVLEQGVVIRFQGLDFEVGFLVLPAAAREFFAAIGVDPAAAAVEQSRSTPRPAPEGPAWPKVTHTSVWAMICAALAFIPVIGLVFGLSAVILIIVFRVRSRPTVALAHARFMCKVALVLALIGMSVSLVGVWSFLHVGAERIDDIDDRLFAGSWDYSHGAIAAAILVVLASLSIHECGHAITAWWCGDGYARSLGRVTLNPIAHIDLFGTIILPLLLAVGGAPVFGYAKPVPVQLGGVRRYRRAHILVSLAGPGSNLLLAAVALMLHLLLGCVLAIAAPDARIVGLASPAPQVEVSGMVGAEVVAAVVLVLKLTFMINLLLAFFNLIPIPPLDGSWILQHLFPGSLGRFYARIRPYGILIFLALFWTGGLEYLMVPMLFPLLCGFALVAGCTGL